MPLEVAAVLNRFFFQELFHLDLLAVDVFKVELMNESSLINGNRAQEIQLDIKSFVFFNHTLNLLENKAVYEVSILLS